MGKKVFKKLSVLTLAVLVFLNSFSLYGLGTVYAEEGTSEVVTEQTVEMTETASEPETSAAAEEVTEEEVTEPLQPETTQPETEPAEPSGETIDVGNEGATDEPPSDETNTVISDETQEDTAAPAEITDPETTGEQSEPEDKKDEETTEAEKESEEDSVKMPAKTFTGISREVGLSVCVDADEGTFPEGTEMKLAAVNSASIIDQIDAAVEGDVLEVKAVDITFWYKGGEIQPAKEVKVTLRAAGMGDASENNIVHIDDHTGKVDVIDNVETSGEKASFDAASFSVYAVVSTGENARLQVNFHQLDGTTAINVKLADTTNTQTFSQVLYDPGAGTLPLDGSIVFYGWTTEENYTMETLADSEAVLTIDQIRTQVQNRLNQGVTDGEETDYYALLFKVITVSYKNSMEDGGIVVGSDKLLIRVDDEDPAAYTVHMDYAVTNPDQEFLGWYISPVENAKINGEPVDSSTPYPNGTEITLSGNVVMTVDAPTGHWLIFKENGKGAKYTPPQFIDGEVVTETARPAEDPTRHGYDFVDWYEAVLDEEGNPQEDASGNIILQDTPFTFGTGLTKNITVYAKWTQWTHADYSVIIWKQNTQGNGYDFVEAKKVEDAEVGSVPDAAVRVNDATARVTIDGDSTDYTWAGFHFKEITTSSDTVRSDGSTIQNVYFDRNEYSITFLTYQNIYRQVTNNSGTQYGIDSNGEYVRLEWVERSGCSGGGYWTLNGEAYEGDRFVIDGHSWQEYQKFTGLYGSSFSDYGYEWPANTTWCTNNPDDGGTNYVVPFLDGFMRTSDITLYDLYKGESPTPHTFKIYYKQNESQTGYEAANYYQSAAENYSAVIQEAYEGFKPVSYKIDDGEMVRVWEEPDEHGNYSDDIPIGGHTLHIYYDRITEPVVFRDGVYIDANNIKDEELTEERSGQLIAEYDNEYVYGQDVSSFNSFTPADVSGFDLLNGYIFEGWFLDPDCTEKCTFNTLSSGGITVYAKWHEVQYRVFLHAGVDPSEPFSMGDQSSSFRADYGEYLKSFNAIRREYELVGWYRSYDEQTGTYSNPFNFEAMPLNDSVTVPYDQTEPTEYNSPYDTYDTAFNKDSADGRYWIERKLELYARWRSKLIGANGINVVYSAGEGTGAPTDSSLYKDLATATAGSASTPTDADKVFSHWVVQKWTGSGYEDTDETVYPGSTFEVQKAYAKIIVAKEDPEDPETVVDPEDVSEDGSYQYIVQLRAEYINVEEATPTHISWFMNDGSEAFHKDEDIPDAEGGTTHKLQINEAVAIQPAQSRTGYKFLGWALYAIGNTPTAAAAWEADPTNWTQETLTTPDLYYGEDEQFHLDSATGQVVTMVAADEKTPYHAMFAVWAEKLEISVTGNHDEKVYTGSEQSAEGFTVQYKVGEGAWTTTAPDGVSVTLKEGVFAKASGTDVGHYTMNLTADSFDVTIPDNAPFYYDGDIGVTDGYLDITRATMELTASDYKQPYDGKAHSIDVAVVPEEGTTLYYSTVDPESADFDPETDVLSTAPEWTNVTSAQTVYVIAVNDNYNPAIASATVTIEQKAITVSKTDSYVYNGDNQTLSITADSASGVVEGETLTLTGASITGKDVATYTVLDGDYTWSVTKADESDSTGNYTISVSGSLTITPATMTVTAVNYEQSYDGQEHAGGATPSVTEGTTILYSVDGGENWTETAPSIKDVGSVTYQVKAENPNYVTATAEGTLTVTKVSVTVTVTGEQGTVTYNGSEQTYCSYRVVITDPSHTSTHGIYTHVDPLPKAKGTDAGEYVLDLEGTFMPSETAGNYDITFVYAPGKLTIEKAPLTITAKEQAYTYNGQAQGPEGTYTVGFDTYVTVTGLKGGDTLSSITLSGKQTNAGTYEDEIVPSAAAVTFNHTTDKTITDNYNVTYNKATLTINTAGLAATAPEDVVYNATEQKLDPVSVTDSETGATLTKGTDYELSWSEDCTNAGTVTITITGKGNYADATATVTYQITPLAITIKAVDKTKAYDNDPSTDPELTAEMTGVPENGTAPVYSLSRAAGQNAGEYAISVTAEAASNPNYTITVVPGTFRITPVAITIKAENKTKVYDGDPSTDPELTAEVTGVPTNGTAPVYSLSREEGQDAGEYTIRVTAEAASNPNYTITPESGAFTITKATLTITAKPYEDYYDGYPQGPAGTYTSDFDTYVTVEGLGKDDQLSSITLTGWKTNAGTYENEIVPSAAAVTFGHTTDKTITDNYDVVYVNANLTIKKAILAIIAKSQTYTFNGNGQGPEGTHTSGFDAVIYTPHLQGNDVLTEVTLTGKQMYVGWYRDEIVPTGAKVANAAGDDVTDNYELQSVANDLTINKAHITITITGNHDEAVYDGTNHSVSGMTYSCDDPAFVESRVYRNPDCPTTATGKDAGRHPMGIQAYYFTYGSYEDSLNVDATFVVVDGYIDITPAAVTITPEDKTKVYNNDPTKDPQLTAVATGLPDEGVPPFYTLVREEGENVGEYTISVVLDEHSENNKNYTFTTGTGTFTITKAKITLTGEKTVTYNGAEQKLELNASTATGVMEGETLWFQSTPTVKGTDAGTYGGSWKKDDTSSYDFKFGTWGVDKADDSDSTDNYELEITGTLTIEKTALTITAKPQTYTYNGGEQGPAGTYTEDFDTYVTVEGFVGGDALSGITLTGKKTDAGTYTGEIVPSDAAVTFNHSTDKTITDNYIVTYSNGDLTIEKKAVTVTITGGTDSKTYNGAEQSVSGYTAAITDPLYSEDDFDFSGTAAASGVDAGEYPMNLASSQFTNNNTNFDVTFSVTDGKLAITRTPLTITVLPQTYEYDGEWQGDDHTYVDESEELIREVASFEGLQGGDKLVKISLYGGAVEAGVYQNKIEGSAAEVKFNHETEKTINDNYDVTYVAGTLTITKATMTLDVQNYEQPYDGKAHTITVTPLDDNGTTLYYSTDNETWDTAAPTWTDFTNGAKTVYVKAENPNYETATGSGTVTITKKTITLTGSDTVTYNGEEQKLELSAADATGVVEGETLGFENTPTVKGTEVGTYDEVNYSTWYVTKANDDDSTGNYTLVISGTLTITKKAITITVNGSSDTKTYNGSEQTSGTSVTPSCGDSLFDANKFSYSGATTITKTEAGTYTEAIDITKASYNDDNLEVTFEAGTPVSFTIEKLAVTVKITGNHDTKTYDGAEHSVTGYTATATVTDPDSGEQIETDLYKVSGDEADFAFSGTVEAKRTNVVEGEDTDGQTDMNLAVSQFTNTNNNFDVTFEIKADGYMKIEERPVTVTIRGSQLSLVYDGGEHSTGGYSFDCGGDTLYANVASTAINHSGTATASRTDVGTTYMELDAADFSNSNTNFDVTFVIDEDGYVKITKAQMTLTVTDYEGIYDGQAHTVTAAPGVTDGTTLYYSEDGETWSTDAPAYTDVPETPVTVQVKAVNPNYEDAKESGTVTINKKTITLTGTKTETYNGQEKKLELSVADATGIVSGETLGFQSTPTVKGTNAGTYDEVSYGTWYVTKANGDESTWNYDIEVTGTLKIDPLEVTVTVTGEQVTKTYDGNTYTAGRSMTADSDLYDVDTMVTATAPVTVSRTDYGQTDMNLAVSQFSNTNNNFDVTFEIAQDAFVKIEKRTVTVTIQGHTASYTYNGAEQSVSGYDVVIPDPLYTEDDFTFTGTAEVKKTNAGIYPMDLAADQFTNNNDNFNVTFTILPQGGMIIAPAELTVTAENNDKVYGDADPTPLTYKVEGLQGSDTESVLTGVSVTRAEGDNVGEYTITATGPETITNYTVEYKTGVFTITARPVTVTITGEQIEKVYDGNEYTASWSMESGDALYDTATMVGHSYAANVSRTDVGTSELGLAGSGFTNTNDNFNVTFSVTKDAKVTITAATLSAATPADVVFSGKEQKQKPSVANSVTGTALTENTDYELSWSEDCTNVGTVTVTVTGKGNYAGSSATVTYQITKAPVILHVAGATKTVTYNGAEQTVTGKSFSFTNETGAEFTHGQVYTWVGNAEAKGTDAGTYYMGITEDDIQLTDFANRNLDLTLDVTDGWLKIEKAPLTITAVEKTYTYNGGEQGPAGTYTEGFDTYVTVDGLVGDDSLSSITLAGKQTNAGTYENEIVPSDAVVTFNHTTDKTITDNYNVTYNKATLTIDKLAVTVTITGEQIEVTYDGEEHTATWSMAANSSLYDTGTMVETTASASVSRTEYGKSTLNLGIDQFTNKNDNFSVTFVVAKDAYVDISKATVRVTITGDQDEVTYDGNEHTVSGFVASANNTLYKVDGEGRDFTFSGTDTITQTNAGTYHMGLRYEQFTNQNDNFDVTFVVEGDGELIINKAAITIQAENKTKVYDNDTATDPPLSATVTGKPANGVDPVYDLSRDAGQDVGNYTIYVGAGRDDNPNYNITGYTGTFSITAAAITIKAEDKTKVYDNDTATDPPLTATVTGKPAKGVDPVYSLSRAAGQDVNEYAITVTAEADANKNYTITTEGGKFKITPAAITIKAEDKTKVYDNDTATDPPLTAAVTGKPAKGVDPVYSLSRAAGQDVNEYAITVTAEADANRNYTITTEGGKFKITPAAITIKADNKTKVYDNDTATDPPLTATVTGKPAKGVDPVYSLSRAAGQDVNEYAITVTAEAESNPNYTITTEGGKFTITAAEITIKADNKTKVYDNDTATDPALTATVTGKPAKGVAPVYSLSRAAGQDVNEYAITVTAEAESNPNYTITTEGGKFTITAKAVTVKADDAEKVYDNDPTNPAGYSATVTGLIGSDTVEYTVTREEGEDAGEYTITPDGAESQGNYAVTYETGTFTIKAKAMDDDSITATQPEDVVYNGDEQKQPVTVTDDATGAELEEGTDYTIAYSDDVTSVGTVTVTLTGKGNYTGEIKVTYQILPGQYEFTKGMAQHWQKGSSDSADFKVVRNVDDDIAINFFADIRIDGTVVDKSRYEYAPGCVEIYLSADLMETLAVGNHELTAVFKDGSATTTFIVDDKAKEPDKAIPGSQGNAGSSNGAYPKTGDNNNLVLWGSLVGASLAVLVILIILLCKRRRDDDEKEA